MYACGCGTKLTGDCGSSPMVPVCRCLCSDDCLRFVHPFSFLQLLPLLPSNYSLSGALPSSCTLHHLVGLLQRTKKVRRGFFFLLQRSKINRFNLIAPTLIHKSYLYREVSHTPILGSLPFAPDPHLLQHINTHIYGLHTPVLTTVFLLFADEMWVLMCWRRCGSGANVRIPRVGVS